MLLRQKICVGQLFQWGVAPSTNALHLKFFTGENRQHLEREIGCRKGLIYEVDDSTGNSRTMSFSSQCKSFAKGKDKVVILSEDDAAANEPSREERVRLELIPEDEEEYGVIKPNGDINWSCPCLGNMATGPCAVPFRTAFSCFHYSSAEPRGSDCYQEFADMQKCMSKYTRLYPRDDDEPTAPTVGDDIDDLDDAVSTPFPGQTTTSSAYPAKAATAAAGKTSLDTNNAAPVPGVDAGGGADAERRRTSTSQKNTRPGGS